MELPLWRTYAGVWAVDSSRAQAAGLSARPLSDTVADTWAWLRAAGATVDHDPANGISPDKETAVLGAWDARNRYRCVAQ
jgi:2'-hydroxyisoflavone reductase